MPTKYRRVAVIQDEQLEAAMKRASARISARSDASLLRELALIGARVLNESSDISPGLQKILAMPGVRPARGSIRDFLRDNPPVKRPEGSDPHALSKALEEQREERL